MNAKVLAAVSMILPLLIVGPPYSALGSEQMGPPMTNSLTRNEERALAFRQTFGFDAELTLIRHAEASPDYADWGYGVPLSAAEATEMGRRVQVEQASYAGADFGSQQTTWGGYYIDQQSHGAPVFLFTGDVEGMRAQLQKLVPDGTGVRVERVQRTLSELTRAKEAITEARAELRASGTHVTSVAVDLVRNDVVVGIEGLVDADTRHITDRFGTFIRFEEMGAAHSDACPHSGCRPIKGGIRVVGPAGVTWKCTAGFIVRRTSDASLSVLTAGHCLWAQTTTPVNDDWYHGGSANVFGDAKYHSFVEENQYGTPTNGDVGLIKVRTSETDLYSGSANRIYTDLGAGTVHPVTSVVHNLYQTQGSQACAYGAASNDYYCTIINIADADRESCADPAWGAEVCWVIQHTKVYGYDLILGDSGGPIFQRPNPVSINVSMLGTHVHSNVEGNPDPIIATNGGWYTSYDWGKTAYQQAAAAQGVNDNYNLCVTALC